MESYIVNEGDSLDFIADTYGVSAQDIIKLNNLDEPYDLKENTILYIPTSKDVFNYYRVKLGDTLYSISEFVNSTPLILAKINGIDVNDYIYPDQVLMVPKQDVLVYATKENDTIDKISKELNIYPENLLYQNKNIFLLPDQLIFYRSL